MRRTRCDKTALILDVVGHGRCVAGILFAHPDLSVFQMMQPLLASTRAGMWEGIPIVAWLLVIIAGLLEVIMAISLKESHGFTRWQWTVSFVFFAIASFGLLSLGLRSLPVGSAYAVWTGIGAAGTAIVGMVVLGDSRDALRLLAIALIISGVVMLQLVGGTDVPDVSENL